MITCTLYLLASNFIRSIAFSVYPTDSLHNGFETSRRETLAHRRHNVFGVIVAPTSSHPLAPTSSSLHIITHSHFAPISFVRIRVPFVRIASHRIASKGKNRRNCVCHIHSRCRSGNAAACIMERRKRTQIQLQHGIPILAIIAQVRFNTRTHRCKKRRRIECVFRAFTWWSRYSADYPNGICKSHRQHRDRRTVDTVALTIYSRI